MAEALQKLKQRLAGTGDANLERLAETLFERADGAFLRTYGVDSLEEFTRRGLDFLAQLGDEPRVEVFEPSSVEGPPPHSVIMLALPDRPFIVDSVQAELRRRGRELYHQLHPVLRVSRDSAGNLTALGMEDGRAEAFELFFTEPLNEEGGAQLKASVAAVLRDVTLATDDYGPMRQHLVATEMRIRQLAEETQGEADADDINEYAAFLNWLGEDNFIFLGYREYDIVEADGKSALTVRAGSGLGVLRKLEDSAFAEPVPLEEIPAGLRERVTEGRLFTVTKANREATVHRPRRMDYVGVKRIGSTGEVLGEDRFLGLFTTRALSAPAPEVPILRRKLEQVLAAEEATPGSHTYKAITAAFNSMPREELFWADAEQIREDIRTILQLEQERVVRLTLRTDPLGRGVAVMVVIPSGSFSEKVRVDVQEHLMRRLAANRIDSRLIIAEDESHVRLHYFFSTSEGATPELAAELEKEVERLTRGWGAELEEGLTRELGEAQGGALARKYGEAFDERFRATVDPNAAARDIANLEKLAASERVVELEEGEAGSGLLHIYHRGHGLPLSDVLPLLENLGFFVVEQNPYALTVAGVQAGIDRYAVEARGVEQGTLAAGAGRIKEAVNSLLAGEAEDDRLNALVLKAGLTIRQVALLRLYQMYLVQINPQLSKEFVNGVLLAYPQLATELMSYYQARFSPEHGGAGRPTAERLAAVDGAEERTLQGLTAVRTLAEDQAVRGLLDLMRATVRTSYYLGLERISVKIDSAKVGLMPEPRPMFEIAVASPYVEGTHLRGGKVARGGIRWSDRPTDFRTEVLGLLKTQTTKNAVIVPVGSKGGFVIKRAPQGEELRAFVREQYQAYIRGLLDLTDNLVAGEVVPPQGLVIYDEDDPYLVVAADKGTAAFSDLANETAAEYDFWLGDAFASGGSAGYDHKGMGITARGAWEAVKRHFAEEGIDLEQPFTVAGIGDMSGDVFGNGMLYTDKIRLQGAFNHLHIFLDPNPDPESSYEERKRLFELPRSTWNDYDTSLISAGGGVFERSAKSIPLSDEVRAMLGVEDEALSGQALIQAVLKMPVDLLWNGGIGTYVKSEQERHAEVGDSANDGVRVNGTDLTARVVGEGGNLGFTQLGRIEYALKGGRIDTDAIDNSAGVNSSDIEVNIKVLLQPLTATGELGMEARKELLHEMTDEVARLVLRNNFNQTRALSLAQRASARDGALYASLLDYLVDSAGLNPKVEFLPSSRQLEERRHAGLGFTRPELAVMLAYVKMGLYNRLLETELPGEAHLQHYLYDYFPHHLTERYAAAADGHRLRREITATVITNELVDNLGIAFVHRAMRDNGASAIEVVRAALITLEAINAQALFTHVKEFQAGVNAHAQYAATEELIDAVEGVVSWMLFNNIGHGDFDHVVGSFRDEVAHFQGGLRDYLPAPLLEEHEGRVAEFVAEGFSAPVAEELAGLRYLPAAFGIIEVSRETGAPLATVARNYFQLGERLSLGWLGAALAELPGTGPWEKVALTDLIMDLRDVQQTLTATFLSEAPGGGEDALASFLEPLAALGRYEHALAGLKEPGAIDLAAGTVMVRLLRQAEAAAAKGRAA